jgi:hypothetical protein
LPVSNLLCYSSEQLHSRQQGAPDVILVTVDKGGTQSFQHAGICPVFHETPVMPGTASNLIRIHILGAPVIKLLLSTEMNAAAHAVYAAYSESGCITHFSPSFGIAPDYPLR